MSFAKRFSIAIYLKENFKNGKISPNGKENTLSELLRWFQVPQTLQSCIKKNPVHQSEVIERKFQSLPASFREWWRDIFHNPPQIHLKFFLCSNILLWFPRWFSGKELICQCRRHGFNPWVGKIPWRRKWQPISVFLPGKSHGQRRLAGYSP